MPTPLSMIVTDARSASVAVAIRSSPCSRSASAIACSEFSTTFSSIRQISACDAKTSGTAPSSTVTAATPSACASSTTFRTQSLRSSSV